MTARTDRIQHFLLIYDRHRDELMSHESFGADADAATTAYRAAEIEYHDRPEMDIVLVGSDSLETVKVTHSTYFSGAAARLLDSLQPLLPGDDRRSTTCATIHGGSIWRVRGARVGFLFVGNDMRQ